jgi:hypothetical protein
MFKKAIIFAVLALLFGGAPLASADSVSDIQAQINAIVAKIRILQSEQAAVVLNSPSRVTYIDSFCYTFNQNLKIGDQNSDVTGLDRVLVREGFLTNDQVFQDGRTVLSFDEMTASAVVGFQEKYASDILAPSGLRRGTGYVGPTTRAKLNALYACKTESSPVVIQPIYIPPAVVQTRSYMSITPESVSKEVYVNSSLSIGFTVTPGSQQSGSWFDWQLIGSVPSGVSIVREGAQSARLQGVPTQIGNYGFKVRATNTYAANSYVESTVYILVKTTSVAVFQSTVPACSGLEMASEGTSRRDPYSYQNDSCALGGNGYRLLIDNSTVGSACFSRSQAESLNRGIFANISIGKNQCAAEPLITVTYPQTGYTLYNNLSRGDGTPTSNPIATITWTSANVGYYPISIELVNASGSIIKTIATGLSNTGSYRWLYDSSIPTGSYKILVSSQIQGVTSRIVMGKSSLFSLVTDTGSAAVPTIFVTSPNGGEWREGSTVRIQWTRSNLNYDNVQLIAVNVVENKEMQIGDVTSLTKLSTYYDWKIPSSFVTAPKNFYIKLNVLKKSSGGYGVVSTVNSSTFVVSPSLAVQPITITYPTYGSVFTAGQEYALTFSGGSSSGVTSYAVYLLGGKLGASNPMYLGTAYPWSNSGSGTFSWVVPSEYVGYSGYQVMFVGKNMNGVKSQWFSITSPVSVNQNPIVNAQNGYRPSGVVAPGVSISASLTSVNEDRVGSWDNFGPGKAYMNQNPADFGFTLSLVQSLSTRTVKSIVIFYNTAGEGCSTSKDNVYFSKAPYPMVVVKDGYQLNSAYDVSLGTYGTGSFTFKLYCQPETTPFSGGKILVTFTDGTFATASLASSTVIPALPSTSVVTFVSPLTLLSPNGGESITKGGSYKVTWSGASAGSRMTANAISDLGATQGLFTSVDSSSGYADIAMNVEPGRYKIILSDGSGTDSSDSYFTVTAPVVPMCRDSDGGKNTNVAGLTDDRVNSIGSYFVDISVDPNGGQCQGTSCTAVSEGYCSGGKVSNIFIPCSSGYSVNGACAMR